MVSPIETAPRFAFIRIDLWACGCWWNNCHWDRELGKWVHHKLGPVDIKPTYWAPVPHYRKGKRYA